MKTFKVRLVREVLECVDIEVVAPNKEQAEDAALEYLSVHGDQVEWCDDNGNEFVPYVDSIEHVIKKPGSA